jgi:hypothetical protein
VVGVSFSGGNYSTIQLGRPLERAVLFVPISVYSVMNRNHSLKKKKSLLFSKIHPILGKEHEGDVS